MKFFLYLILSINIFFSICCKKSTSSPTEVAPVQKPITLNGYGVTLDSSYYVLWSDSSWEKFNGIVNINGATYTATIDNDSEEYFYNASGYCGFKPEGEIVTIFDKPLPTLPDTIVIGQTYQVSTTFFYQGYNYSLTDNDTFTDTVTVSVPVGIFNDCVWFTGTTTISVQNQPQVSNIQFWLANGPGTIKETLSSGVTIVLLRGVVNGKEWGMSVAKTQSSSYRTSSIPFMQKLLKPLMHFTRVSGLTSRSS